MTLVALYRMGGTPEQMYRYVGHFRLRPDAKPVDVSGKERLTTEDWRAHLGRAGFAQFVELFESWVERASLDTVLREVVPVLATGLGGAFNHSLLRLGYAIDYDSRVEAIHSLADWAAGFQPSPEYDACRPAAEPDALLSEIVRSTAELRVEPRGGTSGPIAFRLGQVYSSRDFLGSLRPVRIPDSDPLGKISELLMEEFTTTHDFTLLHSVTTCQAMRLVLPYVGDPRRCLSVFWHSACAAHVTVLKARPVVGRDSVTGDGSDWKEIFARASAADPGSVSAYEHTIKLTYSCWLEAQKYQRERYRALADREVDSPCRFV